MTKTPIHGFDSNISLLLLGMYERGGNRIALQYGGSELAHSLSTINTLNVSVR